MGKKEPLYPHVPKSRKKAKFYKRKFKDKRVQEQYDRWLGLTPAQLMARKVYGMPLHANTKGYNDQVMLGGRKPTKYTKNAPLVDLFYIIGKDSRRLHEDEKGCE